MLALDGNRWALPVQLCRGFTLARFENLLNPSRNARALKRDL
jgi:hypothetical protein